MSPKALIIYCSLTGNTDEMAEMLVEEFKKLNIVAQAIESEDTKAEAFKMADICVIGSYTYGNEGNRPDEIEDVYIDMEDLDLSGKVFGSMGSGEEFYGYFCKAADDFDRQFQKTGAVRGADVLKIELFPEDEDKERIAAFAKSLVACHERMQNRPA